MPIPKPNKDEKQKEYISRCMAFLLRENRKMKKEQVAAICYDSFRKKKK